MTPSVSSQLSRAEALMQQSQALLIDYLRVDIALGFTVLNRAKSTKWPHARAQSLRTVRQAINSTRRLLHRVRDARQRSEIEADLNKLEAALMKMAR